MENLLREYMERAFSDRGTGTRRGQGPVVTISREFGCPSKLVAQQLAAVLNKHCTGDRQSIWRFINKEVVEDIARTLGMNSTDVNYVLSSGNKGFVEDVLASFSPSYVSNQRIRKTITAVVRSIADQGHVIIVGRGGAGILRDFPGSLHVRLQAPRDWRIAQVCAMKSLNTADASRLVDEMDKKRTALIELMTGEKFNRYLFHVEFNCSMLPIDEISSTIAALMQTKKLTD